MRFSNVGKCCCALFIGLLTWSRGTSIEEFSTTASVSTRLEIVYIQGCLFELAVPRPAMTGSPGPSAAAAPVTLNLAHYPAADHVTAADRLPEPRISGAIYTRQRLLQLRSVATARQSDIFLTRINRLGIAKDTSRRPRHRGVRGGRKSTPQPIPVHLTSRPLAGRAGRYRRDLIDSGQRCLVIPQRLSLRQTESARGAPPPVTSPSITVASSSNITIELLNVQSLIPKLPDIEAELHQREADVICFTETNLKSGTPDRLIGLPGYRLYRQDRLLGRKKAGGGVAVYLRDTLQATRIATPAPPGQSHAETLWLSVKLNKKRATTVACIYRPPSTSSSQVDADYNHIEEQLQTVITAHPAQRIALTGDLNSDAGTNPAAHRRLRELEERYGLVNVGHQTTFVRGEVQSILDVVLLST